MSVSIQDQIKEAQRELGLRRRLYPDWVQQGRLTLEDSYRQLAAMDAIVETLKRVQAETQLPLFTRPAVP